MTFSPTTAQAFNLFRQNRVDLSPNEVKKARQSRDYLQKQIIKIEEDDLNFPRITGKYKPYGSFARKTKVRPLDDLDMLVMINGRDFRLEMDYGGSHYTFNVKITSYSSPLKPYADEYGYVNSTKILNQFKSGLQKIPNYRKSEIKRSGVAVVLNLKSYTWAFDIVPTLPVCDYSSSISCYLIPNGKGQWMKTDPRIDQELVTDANKAQNGYLLPLIRLIKYWNVESYAAPRLTSYHLETLLINAFKYGYPAIVSNIRSCVPNAFQQLASHVMNSCPDPKDLGAALDADFTYTYKKKVYDAANKQALYAIDALQYEQQGNHKEAIKCWKHVFPNFE